MGNQVGAEEGGGGEGGAFVFTCTLLFLFCPLRMHSSSNPGPPLCTFTQLADTAWQSPASDFLKGGLKVREVQQGAGRRFRVVAIVV